MPRDHLPGHLRARQGRAATPAQTRHATGAHRPQAPRRRPIQTPQVPRAHGHGRRPAGRGRREGDPVCGAGNRSATGTLAERTTRSTILPHLPDGHDTEHAQDAITGKTRPPPALPRNSPAWDRGTEPAPHTRVSAALDMQAHFRDPHSPRQRGTNDNTNGSPRQHSPKGTDPSGYTEEHPDAVAMEPDDRPRKTPDYMKPSEKTPELTDDTATSTPTDTNNTNCQQRRCNNH